MPDGGQVGGEGPAWPGVGVKIVGWRLTCSETSDESASYTLFILVGNISTSPRAAVTFRVRVKKRQGDVWSSEHLVVENLAPAEVRGVGTSLRIPERARVRRNATVELVGIVCLEGLVVPLASVQAVVQQVESNPDEADEDEPHDGHATGDEDTDDDTEGVAVAANIGAESVTWGPRVGKAGVWTFYPNARLRKDYANCDRDRSGLDCQQGEVLSLSPQKAERRATTLVVTIAEGRVELSDFDTCWLELKTPPAEDCIVWDIYRIVEEWSSE